MREWCAFGRMQKEAIITRLPWFTDGTKIMAEHGVRNAIAAEQKWQHVLSNMNRTQKTSRKISEHLPHVFCWTCEYLKHKSFNPALKEPHLIALKSSWKISGLSKMLWIAMETCSYSFIFWENHDRLVSGLAYLQTKPSRHRDDIHHQ